jgi:hypothetical protein
LKLPKALVETAAKQKAETEAREAALVLIKEQKQQQNKNGRSQSIDLEKQQYAVAMDKKQQFKGRRQSLHLERKAKQVHLDKGDVNQAMVASVLELLKDKGHMFSSSSHEITGADLSAFVVMCKGEHAALDVLQRLDHGGNIFDSWPDLVVMAQDVLNGSMEPRQVTAEDRVDICDYLTQPECDLIADLDKARLEHYVKGLSASAGALTDEEVLSALCSLLSALCSLLSALCSLLSALCSVLSLLSAHSCSCRSQRRSTRSCRRAWAWRALRKSST